MGLTHSPAGVGPPSFLPHWSWLGFLVPCTPLSSTSPSPGEVGDGGCGRWREGVSKLPAWVPHSTRQGGVGGQHIGQRLREEGILLRPFSCSAISCPAPAPSMFHLLLLNHFLFTACLLQPPSSDSSQQPSQSSPDGCLDRQTRARQLFSWVGRAQPFQAVPGAGEHGPASAGLGHGPGRTKKKLPGPRLTHRSISHPLMRISHVL